MHTTPLLLAALVAAPLVQVQDSNATQERMQQFAAAAMQEQEIQGLCVSLSVGSETVFEQGWGRLGRAEESVVAGPATVMPAAYWMEPLVAMALLRHAQAGVLSLEDSVGKHLEGLSWSDRGVQIGHLLSHSSGLPPYDSLPAAAEPVEASDAVPDPVLARIAACELDSDPGLCQTYSNSNTYLMGKLVEAKSGMPLAEYLGTKVFAPLKLSGTTFREGVAGSLEGRPTLQDVAGWLKADADGAAVARGGDLVTSVRDMRQLVRAVVDRHAALGDETLDRVMGEERLVDGTRLAYVQGWSRSPLDHRVGYSMGGVIGRYHGFVLYVPEFDLIVALGADAGEAELAPVARGLVRRLFDLAAPEVEDRPLTAAERTPYLGDYQIGCNRFEIRELGGRLLLLSAERPTYRLLYQGEQTFVADLDDDVRLVFRVDSGMAKGFLFLERGSSGEAVRVDSGRLGGG